VQSKFSAIQNTALVFHSRIIAMTAMGKVDKKKLRAEHLEK